MNQLDLFGSQILFRFKGQPTHNTKFGSIFTISILAVIGLRLFFIIKDVFQRSSPQVIFQERQVDDPSLFSMTNESFQIAFGMQDGNFDHYIDEQIYEVAVTQRHKKKVLKNGVYVDDWQDREIPLKRCTLDNFPDISTRPKFEVLAYQNMLCFPPNEELFIEGDFPSPSYQFLRMTLRECQPTSTKACKSPDIIKKYLKSANFAMYFSDINVDPTQKNEPFQKLARDIFFTTSTQVPKDVDFFFRNSYVESDFGWVAEDIQTKHTALFNRAEVGIQPSDFKDYYLQLILRFEKQKENLYQRKYKNLNSIISEIGGFTQSLLAIGFLICSRFSQLDLNKNIINEAFNFKNISSSTPIQSNEIISPRDSIDIPETKREDDIIQKSIDRNRDNSNFLNIYPCSPQSFAQLNKQEQLQQSTLNFYQSARGAHSIEKRNLSHTLNETLQQSYYQPQSVTVRNPSQNLIQINQNQMSKYSPTSRNNQSKLKNQLNDTTFQGSSLDNEKQLLSNMIQNQNDIHKSYLNQQDNVGLFSADHEKLKRQQFKLEEKEQKIKESVFKRLMQKATSHMSLGVFEYLKLIIWPFGQLKQKKKVLDFGIDTLYYHLDVLSVIKKLLEVDKLKRILLDQDQLKLFDYIPKPTIYSNYGYTSKDEDLKIKIDNNHQDKRTELQKAQQAFQAYQSIVQKQNISLLDSKIVDMVDPQLLQLFGHPDSKQENYMQNLYYQNLQNNHNQQGDSLIQISKQDIAHPQFYQSENHQNGLNKIQSLSSNSQNQVNNLSPKTQPIPNQIKSQNLPQKQKTHQKEQRQLSQSIMNTSINKIDKSYSQQQQNQQQQQQQLQNNESDNVIVPQTIPMSLIDNNIPLYSPEVKSQSQMSVSRSSENADEEQHHRENANDLIVNQPKRMSQETSENNSIDKKSSDNNST